MSKKKKSNKKKSNKKKELTKYQKITMGIGIIGLIIGIGALIGTQLVVDLDPGGGGIPVPPPPTTNGDPPPPPPPPAFDVPVIVLESVEILYLDETSFTFKVFITQAESVISAKINVYDDEVFDFDYALSPQLPENGFYMGVVQRSQFSDYVEDSEITIDVKMLYYHDDLGYHVESVEEDVVEGFSFFEFPPPPPVYEAPEIVEGSFEFEVIEPHITFSFATTNYEYINSISYYFMVDNVIVEDGSGNDVIKTMASDGSGVYSTSFDYSQFDLEKITYVYLIMDFENEDEEDEDRIFEEFTYFGYEVTPTETPTNGGGINYLFAIIATAVALTIFTLTKKRNKVIKNNA